MESQPIYTPFPPRKKTITRVFKNTPSNTYLKNALINQQLNEWGYSIPDIYTNYKIYFYNTENYPFNDPPPRNPIEFFNEEVECEKEMNRYNKENPPKRNKNSFFSNKQKKNKHKSKHKNKHKSKRKRKKSKRKHKY
jgi:hypothetical protein